MNSFLYSDAEMKLGAKALDALRGAGLSIGQTKRILLVAEELLDGEPLSEPRLEGQQVAAEDED